MDDLDIIDSASDVIPVFSIKRQKTGAKKEVTTKTETMDNTELKQIDENNEKKETTMVKRKAPVKKKLEEFEKLANALPQFTPTLPPYFDSASDGQSGISTRLTAEDSNFRLIMNMQVFQTFMLLIKNAVIKQSSGGNTVELTVNVIGPNEYEMFLFTGAAVYTISNKVSINTKYFHSIYAPNSFTVDLDTEVFHAVGHRFVDGGGSAVKKGKQEPSTPSKKKSYIMIFIPNVFDNGDGSIVSNEMHTFLCHQTCDDNGKDLPEIPLSIIEKHRCLLTTAKYMDRLSQGSPFYQMIPTNKMTMMMDRALLSSLCGAKGKQISGDSIQSVTFRMPIDGSGILVITFDGKNNFETMIPFLTQPVLFDQLVRLYQQQKSMSNPSGSTEWGGHSTSKRSLGITITTSYLATAMQCATASDASAVEMEIACDAFMSGYLYLHLPHSLGGKSSWIMTATQSDFNLIK